MNLNIKDIKNMNVNFNLESNSIEVYIQKKNNSSLTLTVDELEGPLKQMALNLCKAIFSEAFILEKSFKKEEKSFESSVVDMSLYINNFDK